MKLANIRSARRGAAAGPSGMTADHLRPLLESERDSEVLSELGASVVRGESTYDSSEEGDGGVRGIVVGDFFPRVVARTIAQQIAKSVKAATSPFQYALSTKARTECVNHILQTLTDMDAKLTILSVDGIGAFDHVSRNSMFRGLMETDVANSAFPFVRQFYGQPSACFWDDELGNTQVIPQGEGGEQGDPLMPLLFCLSLHKELVAAKARLREGEFLFAFLDDVYATCAPEKVLAVHRILQQEIQTHCGISIHHGKTQIWNRAEESIQLGASH